MLSLRQLSLFAVRRQLLPSVATTSVAAPAASTSTTSTSSSSSSSCRFPVRSFGSYKAPLKQQFPVSGPSRVPSSAQSDATPRPAMKDDEAHQRVVYTTAPYPAFRQIVLNRENVLNAINTTAAKELAGVFHALDTNKDITAAVWTYAKHKLHDTKGFNAIALSKQMFCTGIDTNFLLDLQRSRQKEKAENSPDAQRPSESKQVNLFRAVYSLAWAASRVRTPLIVAMDGFTIGAGAGIASQARYRLATQNTVIAFPQTSLGWFPDAGSSFTLARLDRNMGMYLALTGKRIVGEQAFKLGLATHYAHNSQIAEFGKRIGHSSLSYQFAEDTIEHSFGMPESTHEDINGPAMKPVPLPSGAILKAFGEPTVEGIIEKLRALGGEGAELADHILTFSPTSLKVTHRLISLAKRLPLEECLKLEYRLAQRFMDRDDLVNAPNWNPSKLSQVSESSLEFYFSPLKDESQELVLTYPKHEEKPWVV